MKKLLLLLLLLPLFIACEKEVQEPATNGKLDPTAMIKLRGETLNSHSSMQKAKIYGLTPLEVVENAVNIKWMSQWFGNYDLGEDSPLAISRTFGDGMRDFETPALLMFGTDIITQEGDFYKDFLFGYDVYITDNHNDSIAYVPDSTLINAREAIETAYNDSNYTEVYRLFNEAFIFIPLPPKEKDIED